MARYFDIHPLNPQPRLIGQVVEILNDGGVIAYPTDSGFALGTLLGNHSGVSRIRSIRGVDERHHLTVVVPAFSMIGSYVEMDNRAFRAIKAATPGPYTFILPASRLIPRLMQHPKKKTIGVRVPDHRLTRVLVEAADQPLICSTLIMPGTDEPMSQGWEIDQQIGHLLDAVIEGDDVESRPTTVVDLTGEEPEILRHGSGDISLFV